jgi:Trp operon repressor
MVMATVNFSVPDKVKERFNREFAHENKSQILTRLMIQAVEERQIMRQRKRAINELLKLRDSQKDMPPITDAMIRSAREEGRP